MSNQILLIQVNAIGEGQQKKIEFEITDQVKNITEKVTLIDDSKESFAKLTNSLTKCIESLQENLPHKVSGFFSSKTVIEDESPDVETPGSEPPSSQKFDIENSNVVSIVKEMLIKLRDKNKSQSKDVLSDIDSIVDKIVDEKEFMGDKSAIKTYNKSKLNPDETIFLGLHTIDGKENKEVFLTKDGIITDGFAILPLNSKGLTMSGNDIKITDPGSGFFGGYVRTLKMANKNKSNITFGVGKSETEYDVAVNELEEKGFYGSGLANIGGSKTVSKKSSQKCKTRRHLKKLINN